MCREALLINGSPAAIERLARIQSNGATVPPEVWRSGPLAIIHNRFSVTSRALPHGSFPLETDRHAFCFNGEVYACGDDIYIDAPDEPSDAHFALRRLEALGWERFLEELDFQGTLVIHDKRDGRTRIVTDQLNTSGCFHARAGGMFILASEAAAVHAMLREAGLEAPIDIVPGGSGIVVGPDGRAEAFEYRPHRRRVWRGARSGDSDFRRCAELLAENLHEAVRRRIPKDGPAAVLCSGGVDSTAILACMVRALRTRGELDRLRVITFGTPKAGAQPHDNDLTHCRLALEHLGIDAERHLIVVDPDSVEEWREWLWAEKVFGDAPRLITPNPIRTQVRHTVTMSCALAHAVRIDPSIRVVLAGEAADELFAGYHSMRSGCTNAAELRTRILEKLEDLPLNDAARVILASCHGTTAVLKRFALAPALAARGHAVPADLERMTPAEIVAGLDDPGLERIADAIHPVEVRLPFTSHRVLETVFDVPPEFAVGCIDDVVLPKFLLRAAALILGVPPAIVARPKVPFHEGGTGVRNSEADPLELRLAREFLAKPGIAERVREQDARLRQLGVPAGEDHAALFAAAFGAGLGGLLAGNVFRAAMPDTIYSTRPDGAEYTPEPHVSLDSATFGDVFH